MNSTVPKLSSASFLENVNETFQPQQQFLTSIFIGDEHVSY